MAKKIIGPNGNNMKKILEFIREKNKLKFMPIEEMAKIRLVNNNESNKKKKNPINIFITSKFE